MRGGEQKAGIPFRKLFEDPFPYKSLVAPAWRQKLLIPTASKVNGKSPAHCEDNNIAECLYRLFFRTYAIAYMTLAANEKGLETCIVGGIGNEYTQTAQDIYAVTKMELELPKDVSLAALLLVGYPAEDNIIPAKDRKSFDEIISFEKYSSQK